MIRPETARETAHTIIRPLLPKGVDDATAEQLIDLAAQLIANAVRRDELQAEIDRLTSGAA